MSDVFNPTLVFGVGRLGSEVVSRLRDELPVHGEAAASNSVLAVLELLDPETYENTQEITARVNVEASGSSPVSASNDSTRPVVNRERPNEVTDGSLKIDEDGFNILRLSTGWSEQQATALSAFSYASARRLLRLSHFLNYSSADRLLPPRFSVFVVADLGESEVRKVLNPLIEVVGRTLLSRFSHIFNSRGPEGEPANFGVYPVLMLGGVRDEKTDNRAVISKTLKGLSETAKKSAEWWRVADMQRETEPPCVSRTVLLDDQTTKYVLDRSEIVSSIVGLMTIALFSGDFSDDHSEGGAWPLARFLQGPEDTRRDLSIPGYDAPVFATFGVGTMDVAQGVVNDYICNRFALYIIDSMRPEKPADSNLMDLRELWSPNEIDARLQGYGGGELNAEGDTTYKDSNDSNDTEDTRQRSVADRIERRLRGLAKNLTNRCEKIEAWDSPENITNNKYSRPWFEDLASHFKQTCKDIELQELPQAGEEVDRRGLSLARDRLDEVREKVDRWVWSEPQGWHRARQYLLELKGRANMEAQQFELEPHLPDLPDTEPVRQAVLEVRHRAQSWPRRKRVIFTAAFVALFLTLLFHFMPKWLYIRFVYENNTYIKQSKANSLSEKGKRLAARGSTEANRLLKLKNAPQGNAPDGYVLDTRYDPPGLLGNPMLFKLPPRATAAHFVLDRPYVFIWLYLLFLFFMWIYFRSYLKKRQEEMDQAVRFLKNRIEDLVTSMSNSVRDYFGKRIKFSRDLWIRRLLNRIQDQATEEIARLNVVDRALIQLRHKYREAQKRLGIHYVGPEEDEEDLTGIRKSMSDSIYRRLLAPETLIEIYDETIGDEPNRLQDFFQTIRMGSSQREDSRFPDWRDNAPFADGDRLNDYLENIVKEAGSNINVLERLLAEDESSSGTELAQAMQDFFSQLTGKLSHSVELSAPAGSYSVTRLLVLPRDRMESFKGIFSNIIKKVGLQQAHVERIKHVGSWDTERLHLFVGYSGLRLRDFRWLRDGSTKENQNNHAKEKPLGFKSSSHAGKPKSSYQPGNYVEHNKKIHGKEDHGKENHGKEVHEKENHGKEVHGKKTHGKEVHDKGGEPS